MPELMAQKRAEDLRRQSDFNARFLGKNWEDWAFQSMQKICAQKEGEYSKDGYAVKISREEIRLLKEGKEIAVFPKSQASKPASAQDAVDAVKIAQVLLGVKVDGMWGQITQRAYRSQNFPQQHIDQLGQFLTKPAPNLSPNLSFVVPVKNTKITSQQEPSQREISPANLMAFDKLVEAVSQEIKKHSKRGIDEIREFVSSSLRFYLNASSKGLASKDYLVMVNSDWSRGEKRFFAVNMRKLFEGRADFLEYAEECALGKANRMFFGGCRLGGRHTGPRWQHGAYILYGLEDGKKFEDDPRRGASRLFYDNTFIHKIRAVLHPFSKPNQQYTGGCVAVGGNITVLPGDSSKVKRRTSDILEHIGQNHEGAGFFVYSANRNSKFDYVPAGNFERILRELASGF
ncbi:MAG: hypothetical protein N3F07_01880 [Candidatus Micrarchaeota archaeon]|nr:hypothetical protein [Candidatus Micrarchaeota archaeon]